VLEPPTEGDRAERRRRRVFRATNWILAAYLAWEISQDVRVFAGGALPADVVAHAVAALVLLALVLGRPGPSVVRWDAPALLSVVVSNWHFLLYDLEPRAPETVRSVASAALVVAGVWAAVARVVLGRSYAMLPALRRLRRKGPYRLVRHPIYLSLVVADLCLAASHPSLRNAGLAVLGCAAHVARVGLEDGVLARDPAYADYRARTRWRLVPYVW
jgi:protein-S-isoprenylcysteine O-methyltransferase Ste14